MFSALGNVSVLACVYCPDFLYHILLESCGGGAGGVFCVSLEFQWHTFFIGRSGSSADRQILGDRADFN